MAIPGSLTSKVWQKCFFLKFAKFPIAPNQIDSLDAYIYKAISDEVLHDAVKAFENPPTFPTAKGEYDHYEALYKVFNKCVEACHRALGNSKGGYYSGLKFIYWDKLTEDGCCGQIVSSQIWREV